MGFESCGFFGLFFTGVVGVGVCGVRGFQVEGERGERRGEGGGVLCGEKMR